MLRNFRHAFRVLSRNKGFVTVAIFATGLGIGSNVAMFSVIWGVMLAPLPYPRYDRMMVIWSKVNGERTAVPADDYQEYARQSHLLTAFFYTAWAERHMTVPGDPDPITGGMITLGQGEYMGVPQVQLGRFFNANDGKAGNDRVAVLNHRAWVERFHSDPKVIGKQVQVDGEPYTIIGVRPPSLADKQNTGFTVPLALTYGVHSEQWGNAFARLKPGVTREQAQVELEALTRRIVANHPKDFPRNWKVSLEPFHNDWLDPKLQRNLWLLFASVGFVLLIACANVANLLLAKGASREREMAVRASVGASRAQIFGQLLTESVVLAAIGGVFGVGLGWGLMKAATALLPPNTMPVETDIRLNWTVMLFTAAATILSGIVFGCAPALQALRVDLHDGLKQGARPVLGGKRIRAQGVLVVAEFALALTCLGGAGLAIHSFWNLSRIDPGFRSDHVLTAWMQPAQKPVSDSAQIRAADEKLLDKVKAVPGVEYAALSTNLPLAGHSQFPFRIAGRPADRNNRRAADMQLVTPSFLNVYGVHLLRGRFIDEQDRMGTQPVAVVSETFARRFLAHLDPLAARLLLPGIKPNVLRWGPDVEYQIVGVIKDIHFGKLSEQSTPSVYLAMWQNPWPTCALSVRSAIPPSALTESVRRAGLSAVPEQPLLYFDTMEAVVDAQFVNDRFGAVLYGAFSLAALILAALGIYGVMSFMVAQRSHEMGLRMALGAQPGQVMQLVLRDGMRLALIGVAAGVAGALAIGRMMHGMLYGVGPFDGWSFAAIVVILTAAALGANYIPARQATRADPLTALRQE